MEMACLVEICHLIYKRFLSVVDHLDSHPSMNSTKKTDSINLPVTSQAET